MTSNEKTTNQKYKEMNKFIEEDKSAAVEKMENNGQDFHAPTFKNNAFVLYYHPYNFYSQKVLLILYEKQIDFIGYEINLTNGEQFSSWFLALNSKGEVPVIQDGNFILPDSKQIINYIERKFLSPNHLRLTLPDVQQQLNLRVQYYDQLLGKLPVGALTLGSLIHDDLKLIPKPPFSENLRENCLKKNEKVYAILKQSVQDVKNGNHKSTLFKKLDLQERRKRLVYSRFEFQKLLDVVQKVLLQIDGELTKQRAAGNEWLISNDYTLADVSLGLLLHRLYQLGFENYFWTYGKMTHVENYFLRFKKRIAYQKLTPSNFEVLKDFWIKTSSNVKIGAGVIGMAMFAAFAHK